MSSKAKKKSSKRFQSRVRNARSRSRVSAGKKTGKTPQEQKFVNDVLVRGEAAKVDKDGKLPLHATHAIEQETEDGTTSVRRVRFKLF